MPFPLALLRWRGLAQQTRPRIKKRHALCGKRSARCHPSCSAVGIQAPVTIALSHPLAQSEGDCSAGLTADWRRKRRGPLDWVDAFGNWGVRWHEMPVRKVPSGTLSEAPPGSARMVCCTYSSSTGYPPMKRGKVSRRAGCWGAGDWCVASRQNKRGPEGRRTGGVLLDVPSRWISEQGAFVY